MTNRAATMDDDREMKPAMWRGIKGVCPCCGEGKLFGRYLKVVDQCAVCGEDFRAQRADDGPAYLTILFVAHVLGFAIHFIWAYLRPEPWVMATTLTSASVLLCLVMLPRFKGMVVAIQWAKRMHGFGTEPARD